LFTDFAAAFLSPSNLDKDRPNRMKAGREYQFVSRKMLILKDRRVNEIKVNDGEFFENVLSAEL
jgi:hypothetical protein